jgi:ATP-dependent DNA ligase
VLFGILHDGTRSLLDEPLSARRQRLQDVMVHAAAQFVVCPQTDEPTEALNWVRK